MKAVILAGGAGTRLWPMSRRERPKQFHTIAGDEVLIKGVYRRLKKTFSEENVYFSISPAFDGLMHETFPDVADGRIFIEPEKRDTGPAMGYVAALLELTDPDEPVVFIPSDHYIGDEDMFLQCLNVGGELIRETGKLVDIGVRPSFASTVLGYTKIGEEVDERDGVHIFSFAGHTEKPPIKTAQAYLKDGSYLWHANYYMWTPRKFMNAFEAYAPELGEKLRMIQTAVKENLPEEVERIYKTLPKISIDYAVAEKMDPDDVLIIRGDFGWSDIGAWDTLYDRLSDGRENIVKGKCVSVDTKGSLIYGRDDKITAVLGMQDVIVVDTDDALLICPRSEAQRVKEIITKLKQGSDSYL